MASRNSGTVFCFGYGYTAHFLCRALASDGFTVGATTRDPEKKDILKNQGIQTYLFDSNRPLGDLLYMLRDTTHLVLSIPPDQDGDPVFAAHFEELVQLPRLQWVGYLSSTVVYGDRSGAIVTEQSEIRPSSQRGSRRARAEEQWKSLLIDHDFPLHLFRLAGIYGPGRSALDSVMAGNARRIFKDGHAFSRIHVEDIVKTVRASIDRPNPGQAYNLADDLASSSADVIAYACELLDVPVPPLIPIEDADLTPMAASFYSDNKRVSNDKIKRDLGVTFDYPTYREGLRACHDLLRLPGQLNTVLPEWMRKTSQEGLRG